MPIRRKLDQLDMNVLEVVEDEVWLPEFLRNTADGSVNKGIWPSRRWQHRDYQRQILTDKSKYLSLVGGRSIGKCEAPTARILTVGEGYVTIKDLADRKSFGIYSINKENNLVQRRAKAYPDKKKIVIHIQTESGHRISVTDNHPVLTDNGWMYAKHISPGTTVAVVTKLPDDMIQNTLRWHELRWLGYTYFMQVPSRASMDKPFYPRYKKIAKEIEYIFDQFPVNYVATPDSGYSIRLIRGPFVSPLNALYKEIGIYNDVNHERRKRSIADTIMHQVKENVKVFLEALFAQYATFSAQNIELPTEYEITSYNVQELLLRFGIESKIYYNEENVWFLKILDYENIYKFWNTFTIPGVAVENLPEPTMREKINDFMRYDKVVFVQEAPRAEQTYSIYVYEDKNYISSNIAVHNTVLIEDKLIYEVVNFDKVFPVTPEQVFTTANQAQMTPLLTKIIQRFTSSPLLKNFLKNNINRSEGTMRFPISSRTKTLYFRIAGSRGESNVVGLHIPRIKIDEAQLYPIKAFTQLLPTLNHWEPNTQLMMAGVHNGLRNSLLYIIDQKDRKYKKYRIASHNNPYYSREQDLQNLRDWGGENDDRYQQLVLGRPGSASFQVVSRDQIVSRPYPFYTYRYTNNHKANKELFQQVLGLPKIEQLEDSAVILAIDTGFVDPTVINLIALHGTTWKTHVRYILTRIDFHEQSEIIDWIATNYRVSTIAIDTGPGGGGAGIVHSLMYNDKYRDKNYAARVQGFSFNERIVIGIDDNGIEQTIDAKSHAAITLIRMIQQGELIFSDIDHEGISQIERISKQKLPSGKDRYFIMSINGAGNSSDTDDHIFASFICFALAVNHGIDTTIKVRKLGKVSSAYT